MTNREAAKLIELLRVFINSPCRTKADAELLEAKLAEFEKEIAEPRKRDFVCIQKPIRDEDDIEWYLLRLQEHTTIGYEVLNCGINGSVNENMRAWAILRGPAEEE